MSESKNTSDRSANGYILTRIWFDFAFENPDLVSPSHTAMFLWFVELNNRMGWSEKFASPASQAMAATGIKSFNTYKKIFNELVNFGCVKVIQESKNQYTACIIALSNFDKAIDKPVYKALDKALIMQLIKQDESTVQSTYSIIKQLNKETTKQENKETITSEPAEAGPVMDLEDISFSFKSFWDLYDKKVGELTKVQKKWEKLKLTERAAAMAYIPEYKLAQPKKQFRKNPETFLNNKSWNDEIIKVEENGKKIKQSPGAGGGFIADGRDDFGKL